MVSLRGLLLAAGLFGAGFLVVGPLRSWAQTLFTANAARGAELSRRVQAQRLEAARPELSQIGIDVEMPTDTMTPPQPGTTPVSAAQVELGWRARAMRWWRQIRGVPEPGMPVPSPALTDSAGLRPGEQMFLPDGRVVRYDSSTFRMKREPAPTPGH